MLGPLGAGGVFGMFAAVLLVIALDVLFLGEETKGLTLEEISGAQTHPNADATATVANRG